jgi:hypothetical protein
MATKTLREETIVVESAQTQALARQVPVWVEKAEHCKITTVVQQAAAQQTIIELKGIVKEAKGWFKSLKSPIDAVKAIILKKEHEVVDPLEKALDTIGTAVARFDRQQRDEADRRQNELEAKERKRLEAQKKADEAELLKELAKAKGADKIELKQVLAEVKAAPIIVAPIVVQPKVATTAGLVAVQNWSALVTNLELLQAAIVAGTVPWEAFTVNQPFLNTWARSKKVEGELCPGVVCVAETSYKTAGRAAYDSRAEK